MAVIVLGTFLLGMASPWFYNDHFDSLSRARQVLVAGYHTVFESLDWGRPLQIYLSAVFQFIAGNTLLGEALLTVGAIAISVGLVFLLAAEITGSGFAGAIAALLTVWIEPRLYNYPKLLAPTMGLWLIWRFLGRPARGRTWAMGMWTAVAFLLRHDLGVYVGLASLLAVVLRYWPGPVSGIGKSLAIFALSAALIVLPYLWIAVTRGDLGAEGQRGFSNLLSAATLTWRPFDIRAERPYRFEPDMPPKVTIRWRADLSAAERVTAEQRFGLRDPHDYEPPGTWSYHLERSSREDLRRLVNDPAVDDTALIDRSTLRVIEPWSRRFGRQFSVLRLRPADWLWSRYNAETWIYYLFVFGVLAAGILSMFTRPPPRAASQHGKKLWTLIVLSALPILFLIRHNLDSRLADAAPLSFVTVVFVVHSVLASARSARLPARTLLRVAMCMVVVLTWSSLTLLASAEPISRTLERIGTLHVNLPESLRDLSRRPIETFAPEGRHGVPRLTRWIWDCTSPEDRVLLVGYYPEVFYYSERAFAGGTPFFHPPYFTDIIFQARVVDHMRRERIPLVIAEVAEHPLLEDAYSHVGDYVRENFVLRTEADFQDTRRFQIWIHRSSEAAESQKYPGLPCLRD